MIVKVPEGKVRMMVVGADDVNGAVGDVTVLEPLDGVGDVTVLEPPGVVVGALVIELVLLLSSTLLVVNGPVVAGVLVVGVRSEDTE